MARVDATTRQRLSHSSVDTPPGSRLPRRWWVMPLAVYAAFRLIDTVMILLASRHATPLAEAIASQTLPFHLHHGPAAPPGYLSTATNWDGQWYWDIATRGYPSALPRDAHGSVIQNTWAFFPLYPMTVRTLMTVTGLGFPVAAVAVSLVSGAVGNLLACRLVAPVTDRLGATLLVVVLNAYICSPVFQIAYSEALAFALLAGTLLAFHRGRHVWTAVLVLLLSLTRGVVLPLAAVFLVWAVLQWRRGRGREEYLPSLGLGVWAGVTTFLWPAIAGFVTGEPKAYLLTQSAWNPDVARLPVLRFIDGVSGETGSRWVTVALVVIWTLLVVWVLTARQPLTLLRLWSGLYSLYLLAAVSWNATSMRYYLLAFPALWTPIRQDSGWSPRDRVVVVAGISLAGLALHWCWIRYSLTLTPQLQQLP